MKGRVGWRRGWEEVKNGDKVKTSVKMALKLFF